MINAVVYPTIMHMNDNYVHDQGSSLSYNSMKGLSDWFLVNWRQLWAW